MDICDLLYVFLQHLLGVLLMKLILHYPKEHYKKKKEMLEVEFLIECTMTDISC